MRSLDGLRGLAALVVAFSHVVLASSTLMNDAYLVRTEPTFPSLAWWALYTPLHVFWGGQEAVLVFFVLSGFVLSASVARGRPFAARSYYPQRVARLLVPVAGALLLALLVQPLIPARPPTGTTNWLAVHIDPPTVSSVLKNAALILGTKDWKFTGVLWSMQWEMWFSLLLPGFLAVAIVSRKLRAGALLACATVVVMLVGRYHDSLRYLPAFMLGVILAFHQDQLRRLRDWMARRPAWKAILIVASAVLLTAAWWVRVADWVPAGRLQDLAYRLLPAAATIGATLAVIVPLLSSRVERFLSGRFMQWAGTRSFSLYLVHETAIVALAFVLGGTPAFLLLLVLSAPLVALVTEVFFRVVEAPSHRLAKRLALRHSGQGQVDAVRRPERDATVVDAA